MLVEIYRNMRRSYGLGISDDVLRVLSYSSYISADKISPICLPSSITGSELIRHRLAYEKSDDIYLTQFGRHLYRTFRKSVKLYSVSTQAYRNWWWIEFLPSAEFRVATAGRAPTLLGSIPTMTKAFPLYRRLRLSWLLLIRGSRRPRAPLREVKRVQLWTEADQANNDKMWRDSHFLAFWLCPLGAERGVEMHDNLLKLVERSKYRDGKKTRSKFVDEIMEKL